MCEGGAVSPAAAEGPYEERLQGARRDGAGALQRALVDVLDGEATSQHLDEHLPELF